MDVCKVIKLTEPSKITTSGLSVELGAAAKTCVNVSTVEQDGIYAVYVDAKLESGTFTPENGIVITYDLNGVVDSIADYRKCAFWCYPEFAKKTADIPKQTQALLSRLEDGSWFFALPTCYDTYKCTFRGEEKGISAVVESYTDKLSTCDHQLAFICATGDEPYALVEKLSRHLAKLLNNGTMMRTEKKYPAIFEKLGWCTWDAFNIFVNDDGIQEKIKEFKDKGLPVNWVIIDDMWAYVPEYVGVPKERRLWGIIHGSAKLGSFEGDPEKFPDGLAKCIEKIHAQGLKVGMWYPITGYWRGFHKDGEFFKEYEDCLERINGKWLISTDPEKAEKAFNGIAKWFRDCGADFIKVDNQSSFKTNYFNCGEPVGKMAKSIQGAVEKSAVNYFSDGEGDIGLINCMCMANENMFNRGASSIARCSGDFQPENREWFATHILQCTYNSLFQGQYYYNDWDMWWTGDGQGLKNSVCRAISGGPIYVSDKNGQTNPDILWPLIFNDGTIIRTEMPAIPTRDCLTINPRADKKPMKIYSTKNGAAIIAAFNLDSEEGAVSGDICPADLGFEGEVAVYEYFTKEGQIVSANEKVAVELANPDVFRLYVIAKIENGAAVIGASEKMIAPGTYKKTEDGLCALCDGKFTVVAKAGATVTLNGKAFTAEKDGVLLLEVKETDIIK